MPVPPQKRLSEQREGLGRSCGGFSTKVHAVCDVLGNPLHFIVTTGQKYDAPFAIPLIQNLTADHLLADKGYDSDAIRELGKHLKFHRRRTENKSVFTTNIFTKSGTKSNVCLDFYSTTEGFLLDLTS